MTRKAQKKERFGERGTQKTHFLATIRGMQTAIRSHEPHKLGKRGAVRSTQTHKYEMYVIDLLTDKMKGD
jgi:hypothetical protein